MCVCPFVCVSHFCFSPGGQTFLTQRRGGDKHFLNTGGRGDKHFSHTGGGTNIFTSRGGQTFFVGGSGAYDDVDEEMVVSIANFLMSEASKLPAGARIFRGL